MLYNVNSLFIALTISTILSVRLEASISEDELSKFRSQMIICHNKHRSNHGVKPLSFSDEVNEVASARAAELAARDSLSVKVSHEFGESVYAFIGSRINGFLVCSKWYNQSQAFQYGVEPRDLNKIGHFTQMLWKGSCFLGVGMAKSASGWIYAVVLYDPYGNIEGKFVKNVLPPGRPTKEVEGSPFEKLMSDEEVLCTDVDTQTFLRENLECHNIIRAHHHSQPLIYSQQLIELAEREAETLASEEGQENRIKGYGLNAFSMSRGGKISGYTACKNFYRGTTRHDYSSNQLHRNELTFTQMVWNSSKYTGVGMARSRSGKLYQVNLYDPPGNVIGEMMANVFPPGVPPLPQESTIFAQGSRLIPLVRALAPLSLPTVQYENLECHNNLRRIHSSPPLSYTPELMSKAQELADKVAHKGLNPHLDGLYAGYNLYFTTDDNISGDTACKNWYSANPYHNSTAYHCTDTLTKDMLTFSQLVWKDSKHTGFGLSRLKDGRTYIVALYSPRGNIRGQFCYNVFPPVTSPYY